MKKYLLVRAWRFHGVLETQFKSSPENFDKSGQLFCKKKITIPDKHLDGEIEVRRRIFSKEQILRREHDNHPALDLVFDKNLISSINELINKQLVKLRSLENPNESKINLINLSMRITDFGHLITYSEFDGNSFQNLVFVRADIIRLLTEITLSLNPIFDFLVQQKLIKYELHKFGIPNSFYGLIDINETDTYLYSEHILISEDYQNEAGKLCEILNNEKADTDLKPDLIGLGFCIYNLKASPVWVFTKSVDFDEISYYLAPDVMVLSEITTINSAALLYSEISKFLLENQHLSYLKKLRLKKSKTKYSETLRYVSLNYSLILQKIRYRYADNDIWQLSYVKIFKEVNTQITEGEELYKSSQENLELLISAIESKENTKHQTTVEFLFLIFATFTVGSAYVDVVSFSEKNHSNFQEVYTHFLETKVLLIGLIAIFAFLIIITKRPRY
ncbi:MAG: hypothetical protein K9J37_08805 [Saprospiraceae bacterium]|nr:hypothetical protein [Saprospiraceae bacterium]MCF8250000.1 hypothetical protein [Saprospiraceae bacterium]MCF8278960.1 hypothetical protein [Bacteroidales bacterium]MCF8311013.1 hypothetical protein [Saprospiraceae bacterium]MCF8439651.1 hypothetical protein [Saprospiraceae bacterium]